MVEALRLPVASSRIDPRSIMPQPGQMLSLYKDLRSESRYQDGYNLVLDEPRKPYSDIVADYNSRHEQSNFSPIGFWNENFSGPRRGRNRFSASDGMGIDQYSRIVRAMMLRQPDDRSWYDIFLPYTRAVASLGRFDQSFDNDNTYIMRGYKADGQWDPILDIFGNTVFQIHTFGYPFNGSATFLANRPHIPSLADKIVILSERYGKEALLESLPALEKLYDYWMAGKTDLESADSLSNASLCVVKMSDGSYLNRYFPTFITGPRLESAAEDLALAERLTDGYTGQVREAKIIEVYEHLIAGAASYMDYCGRWFRNGRSRDTINTTHILPIDLNSSLAFTEQMLSLGYELKAQKALGQEREILLQKSTKYQQLAEQRINAINIYLIDSNNIPRDYNLVENKHTDVISSAAVKPLVYGIATPDQVNAVAKMLAKDFLQPGGIMTTLITDSEEQWDGFNGWAPPNVDAVIGLTNMANILEPLGYNVPYLRELADKIRQNYIFGVETVFNIHRCMPEKHRVDNPAKIGNGGEYPPESNLNMTVNAYIDMKNFNPYALTRDPLQLMLNEMIRNKYYSSDRRLVA